MADLPLRQVEAIWREAAERQCSSCGETVIPDTSPYASEWVHKETSRFDCPTGGDFANVDGRYKVAAGDDLVLCPKCSDVTEPIGDGKRQCISCYNTIPAKTSAKTADLCWGSGEVIRDVYNGPVICPECDSQVQFTGVGRGSGLIKLDPHEIGEFSVSSPKTALQEWKGTNICLDCGGNLRPGPKGLVHELNGEEHCPLSIVHPSKTADITPGVNVRPATEGGYCDFCGDVASKVVEHETPDGMYSYSLSCPNHVGEARRRVTSSKTAETADQIDWTGIESGDPGCASYRPVTYEEMVRLVRSEQERRREDRRKREREEEDRRAGGERRQARSVQPEDTDDWTDIDWNNYSAGYEDGLLHKDLSGEPDHGDIYLDGYHDGINTSNVLWGRIGI